MTKTYFWSDLHLGHPKVGEQHRGFADVTEHDASVCDRWRSRITEDDEVFILGDLARSHSEYALNLIAGLPGIKHLISGNHDGTHPMHNRAFRRMRRYLEVFETVSQSATIKVGGERVTLSHFPFRVDHTETARHMPWRVQDRGQWLFHGHTHSKEIITGPREIHVGLDAWQYPVSVGEIEKVMTYMKGNDLG